MTQPSPNPRRRAPRPPEPRRAAAPARAGRIARALAGIGHELAGALDVERVGARVAAELLRLIGGRRSALYRLEVPSGSLVCAATAGRGRRERWLGQSVPVGSGIVGRAVAERRALWSPDLLADPAFVVPDVLAERIGWERCPAALAAPLTARGEVIGALVVGDRAGRRFSAADRAVLAVFADQAALALHNARLYREQEARALRLRTLSRLTRLVSSSLDTAEVLGEIARAAATLMEAPVVSFWTADQAAQCIELAAFSDEAVAGDFPVRAVPFGQGLLGWVGAERQPLEVADVLADGRSAAPGWWRAHGLSSFYGHPIIHSGELIGILTLNGREPFSFGPDDRDLLESFAGQGAVALVNARRYGEARRRQREAEVTAEVGQSISASLELGTVLERVAAAARELCGADLARIALREPGSDSMVFHYWPGARYPDWARLRVEPGKGGGGQALASGRPFRTDDYLNDARLTLEYAEPVRAEGNVSEMVVPILSAGRAEGLLYVTNRSYRPFTDRDEATLLRLADQAALALQNAALFAREREARAGAEASARALRASEEQYRSLIEGSIQGMYIHEERIIRFANAPMALMFGYAGPDELVGRDYRILIAPREHARIEGYRTARLEGRPAPVRYEMEGLARDGSSIWIEVLVSVMSWGGRPAVLGTFLDITERRRVEAAEREASALRSVTQLANAAAHEINNPLAIIVGHLQMLGRDAGLGPPAHVRLGKMLEAAERVRDIVVRMTRITQLRVADDPAGLPARLDLRESSREPAGEEAAEEADPVALVERLRTRIAGLERREAEGAAAEETRREGQALLEKAQAVAHVGSWASGIADESRLVWSPEACRIFGADEGGFDGRLETFWSLVHPEDLAAVQEARRAALAGEARYSIDHRIARPDGTVRWVHQQADVIRDEAGQPRRLLGIVQDITERREAEQARAHLEAQLRQAQKMEAIGALAGGIAHDFNNLLTVIAGRAQLLRTRLADDAALRRDVDLVRGAAERAAVLTRQLLAFSRKQALQPAVIDLNAVVGAMGGILGRLIGEAIDLTSAPAPAPVRVHADRGQLEQVIMNLAVNARDAMPEGGRLTIEIAAVELDDALAAQPPGGRPGPHAMLAVTDTGVGMDEETRARAFEPFFTTKEAGKGTGLGLSTVYGIVAQHGGVLRVESAPGKGARFEVYLPRVGEPEESAVPPPAATRAVPGAETLLLVEDEQGVRELAHEILELGGYKVLEARHPGEALLIGERYAGPIHLLVTDLAMPQMDGLELAERLRALRPEIRILYVSAYAEALIGRHGALAAGTLLLNKPFLPDELLARVRQALGAGG